MTSPRRQGARYRSVVADGRDPGYDSTAVMIAAAATLLAEGRASASGILTPASGLGDRLAERLRERGFTLECGRVA